MVTLWDLVKEIPILDVAKDLDLKIVHNHGAYSVIVCMFHEDHVGDGGKANLSLYKKTNGFKCFACPAAGTTIDLWAKVANVDAKTAVEQLAAKYHVALPSASEPAKKPAKKTPAEKKAQHEKDIKWDAEQVEKATTSLFAPENADALENLVKLRKISPEYIKAKKIGLAWVPGIKLAYTVPAFDKEGKLISLRTHSRLDRRDKRFVSGFTSKHFYDMTSFNPEAPELWITEGEGDFWSLESRGKNALTSFCGAGAFPGVFKEGLAKLGDLAKKDRIVLCADNDNPGLVCMAWIRFSMPKEAKVFKIEWPPGYDPKEDVSHWFNFLNRTMEDLEAHLKTYPWEDAKIFLEEIEAHKKAAQSGRKVYEFANCYWRKRQKKGEIDEQKATVDDFTEFAERISNFVIRGKATVRVERDTSTRVDVVTHDGKIEPGVFLPYEAWTSRNKFLSYLKDTKYEFTGGDTDLQHIMTLCVEKIKESDIKKGVKFIGFQDGFFVGPGFAVGKTGIVEDPPIEYLPQRLAFDENVKLWPCDDPKPVVDKFCETIMAVNKPHVIVPMLGWLIACFFKEEIRKRINYFPIMSLFGTSGAGKTSTITSLLRMFGMKKGLQLFNANESAFVSMRVLSSTNCIPVAVDELKEDAGRDTINAWKRRARSSYSGEIEMRGKQDLSVELYPYRAPLLIIGETSIVREQAVTERTIAIEPKRSDIGEAEREAFKALQKDVQLELLFEPIVKWCLAEGHPKINDMWGLASKSLHDMKLPYLPPRVWDNWTVVMLGIEALQEFAKSLGVNFTVSMETRKEAMNFMTSQILQVGQRTKMGFDDLMEALAIMAKNGIVKNDQDYVAKGEWLYLHLSSCVALFREWARRTNFTKEILDDKEYLNQAIEIEKMQSGRYVSGHSKKVRFGSNTLRTIQINLKRAERVGLDIAGFGFASEQAPNDWETPADETTKDIDEGKPEAQLPPELTETGGQKTMFEEPTKTEAGEDDSIFGSEE